MTNSSVHANRLRTFRQLQGWTQQELADAVRVSRSAITAIEAESLAPSVTTALALASVLGVTVEELFGNSSHTTTAEVWAWPPAPGNQHSWVAEISGVMVRYPAEAAPMLVPLPDLDRHDLTSSSRTLAQDTLVVATCDPAAGLLASYFAQSTGLRMLIVSQSSTRSMQMLKAGLVHCCGLHLSTDEAPGANAELADRVLQESFHLLRVAEWQEGVAVPSSSKIRSVRAAVKSKLTWIGREAGSGARRCLERVLGNHAMPRRSARNHRSVAAAIESGWAEAGVCVQLASAEAGLDFIPVQSESYDLCYRARLADDRRMKALLAAVRSSEFRRLLGGLPGYDTQHAGVDRTLPRLDSADAAKRG